MDDFRKWVKATYQHFDHERILANPDMKLLYEERTRVIEAIHSLKTKEGLSDLTRLKKECEQKDKVIEALQEDAQRWRAISNSERVRYLGSGGLGEDHQHIGLELWDKYPEHLRTQENGIAKLTVYVDTIRARLAQARVKEVRGAIDGL